MNTKNYSCNILMQEYVEVKHRLQIHDLFVKDFTDWYNGKITNEISKLKNQDPKVLQ